MSENTQLLPPDATPITSVTADQLLGMMQTLNRVAQQVSHSLAVLPVVQKDPVDNTRFDAPFDYHSPQSDALPQPGGILARPEGHIGVWSGSYN